MKSLLFLRVATVRARLHRFAQDISVYLSDGAWITYLFVMVIFGGSLVDMLMHPERLSPAELALSQVAAGSMLFGGTIAFALAEVFRGFQTSPLSLSPGDTRFLLLSPLAEGQIIGERLASLHLERLLIGAFLGALLWPFLQFLWSRQTILTAISLGPQLAVLSSVGLNAAILLALTGGRLRRILELVRTMGGLLFVAAGLIISQVAQVRGAIISWGAVTESLTRDGSYPPLLGYRPERFWLPLLCVWLVSLLLVWFVLSRTGAVNLASRSAIWLKVRSMIRAGRKAEARRLLTRTLTEPTPGVPSWTQRYSLPIYGPGVKSVLFRQLTVLFRHGPASLVEGLIVPAALFLMLLTSNTLILKSVGGLVGGSLLILSVVRWLRMGSGHDLASLNSLSLLPIYLREMLVGQLVVPAVGVFPLVAAAAVRVWLLLGGGLGLALLLLAGTIAASMMLSAIGMLEDWLRLQSPLSRDHLFVACGMTVLPVHIGITVASSIGVLVFTAVAIGVSIALWKWLTIEIGKALLGS